MTKSHKTRTLHNLSSPGLRTAPFVEHVRELRRRAVWISLSVATWSIIAYAIERHIISFLLWPARHQSFIYTSPVDGLNFLFKICLYTGIACSVPVFVYHFLRFIEPLMRVQSSRFIRRATMASGFLACVGVLFGYFFGLPTALHFLLHQFVSPQIRPLLTIDAYLSFVLVYMLGAALIFQIPLILTITNRIKPLTPKGLLRQERWAILLAVLLGFIMNPTPNLLDQLFVVVPIILSYQLSILLIWWQNRIPKYIKRIAELRAHDAAAQGQRIGGQMLLQPMQAPPVIAKPSMPPMNRPRQYLDGFVAR